MGFQRLLDLPGYDVMALAEKSGTTTSHIYARLSLLQIIPNVWRGTIRLPVALDGKDHDPYVLMLYLSVPGGQFPVDHLPSAQLYAESHNLQSFCRLAPGKTLRVDASTRFRPRAGHHAFTAHAEFLQVIGGTPRSLGFADSKIIPTVFAKTRFFGPQ